MNRNIQKIRIFIVAISILFSSEIFFAHAASKKVIDATTYPVLAQSDEELKAIIEKGTRDKDGKRQLMTAHLEFPVMRKGRLGIKSEINSANTKITAEKDLSTGEVKVFVFVETTTAGKPTPMKMVMLDGSKSFPISVEGLSRFESTSPSTWQSVCNKFTGCQQVLFAGVTTQRYSIRAELPLQAVQDFAQRTPEDRTGYLAFWLGEESKEPRFGSRLPPPEWVLFRNQAQAVLKAIEIAPDR